MGLVGVCPSGQLSPQEQKWLAPSPPHTFVFNHFSFTVDLDVGIPLPKVLNVNFASAALEIIEVSFSSRYGFELWGMPCLTVLSVPARFSK